MACGIENDEEFFFVTKTEKKLVSLFKTTIYNFTIIEQKVSNGGNNGDPKKNRGKKRLTLFSFF